MNIKSQENSKECLCCKKELNLDCFSKNKNRKDGYDSTCKDCIFNYNTIIECECGVKIKKYYLKHHLDKVQHLKNLLYNNMLKDQHELEKDQEEILSN